MASRTSFFNRALIRRNFARFWPVALFYGLIWFVSQPLLIRSHILNGLSLGETPEEIRRGLALVLAETGIQEGALMSFGFGILAAMAVFSYLTSLRSSAALHALPLRREEHFLSNYVSGLLLLVIPNVAVFLSTVIVETAFGLLDITPPLKWLGAVTLQNIFFFSFASLCAVVTGHLLALPVFYGVLNALVPGLEFLVRSTVGMFIYGMNEIPNLALEPLSPVFYYLTRSHYFWDTPEGWRYTVLCALVGLAFAAAALALYRARRVETAGDIVSFRAFKPIFKYGVAFCAALFFGMLVFIVAFGENTGTIWQFLFCALVMGAIGYFAAEMLLKKSFRVFSAAWKGWLCFSAVLVALAVCVRADLFGFERYVPELQDVDRAVVSLYFRSYFDKDSDTRILGMNGDIYIPRGEEELEAVLDLHESIVDRRREYFRYSYAGADVTPLSLSIQYQLKNGRVVARSYTVPVTDAILADPDTPAARYEALMNDPKVLPQLYFPENLTEENFGNGRVDGNRGAIGATLSQAQSYVLYQALLKDLEAGRIGRRNFTPSAEIYPVWIELRFTGYFPEWVGAREDEEPYQRTYYAHLTLTRDARNTIEALKDLGVLDDQALLELEREEEASPDPEMLEYAASADLEK